MSVSLLSTSLFERLRLRVRSFLPTPPAGPRPEKPRERRARLRKEVTMLGGNPTDIETIRGDCPAQTDQQIGDLSRWLEARRTSEPRVDATA